MTGDHHGQAAAGATLLLRAPDGVLGTHRAGGDRRGGQVDQGYDDGLQSPACRTLPGGPPNGAATKAPPLPRAPSYITERAAAHSLQFGSYASWTAGLLAALAVRPVPSCP
jgi:hypothetical protein